MADKQEVRIAHAQEVRVNNSEEDNEMIISGYALKFNTMSQDLGGFRETISKRALDNADMSSVQALINHDPNKILSRTENESLKLTVDDTGLRFKAKLPNTTYAKDLYENIRVGNIGQCSFGFTVDDNGDSFKYDREEGLYTRTINEFKKIFDVTVTSQPAYLDTNVAPALRSIEHIEKEEQRTKELELLQLEMDMLKLKNK